MSLTLDEVLSLKPFQNAGILAGEGGLKGEVKHVTVVEVPGVERWGMQGGLLLSTLYAYPDKQAQCELVAFLGRRKRAVGLVLHPGSCIEHHYEDMAHVANKYDFPLIRLPVTVSYLAVFQAVYGALYERQARLLRRSEAINREFTEAILAGRDIKCVCDMLHDFVMNPVLVVSADMKRHLAWAGSFSEVQELANAVDQHVDCVAASIAESKPTIVALQETDDTSVSRGVNLHVVPIHAAGELVRYLVVPELTSAVDEIASIAIMHAATALAMDALQERAGLETERRFIANLLDDLLSGRVASLESLNQRGDALGMNLRNRRAVIYLVAKESTQLSGLTELLSTTEEVMRQLDPGAIVTSRGDGVVVVPSLPSGQPRREADTYLRNRASELHEEFCARGWKDRILIAVGTVVEGTLELGLSFQTALWLADMQRRMGEQLGTVSDFDGLGVYRLGALDIDDQLLKHFIVDTLAPIHEGGGLDKSELLRTLEVFLDCRESYVAAAEQLFVHPNTVKYRIEKLRDMFMSDPLKNDSQRLALHVALKLRKV